MPTGYTAELMESGQPFNDFVMGCARAMGACIMMRDDPANTEIPDEFTPSNYYAESILKKQRGLEALLAIEDDKKEDHAIGLLDAGIKGYHKYKSDHEAEDNRLESMKRRVLAWVPPTAEHRGLKDFMLQQISVSKNCSDAYSDKEIAKLEERKSDLSGYFEEILISKRSDLRRAEKGLEEEIERCRSRTEWIKQLRLSLKP